MRFDLVFSYWIFAWFVCYYFHITTYNPKLLLIVGLFENSIMFFLMLFYKTRIKTIIYFCMINFFIKIVPLYYLQTTTIQLRDIYASLILTLLFTVWLFINHESITKNRQQIMNALLYGKGQTPMIELIEKTFKHI
jgi:hypothetical protein